MDAIHSFDRSTKVTFAPYEKPDWAKGYDVIVHDECSADVKDVAYVNNILAAHRAGIPAVNLHCAMHSYRVGNISQPVVPGSPDALWFDLLGLQSTGHGPQEPIQLTTVAKDHPIMAGQPEWTTIKEELYNNIKIFPSATPLMRGKQLLKQKDGSERAVESVVTWVNEYGPSKTRVFSSTVGHNNDTVADIKFQIIKFVDDAHYLNSRENESFPVVSMHSREISSTNPPPLRCKAHSPRRSLSRPHRERRLRPIRRRFRRSRTSR